MYPGQFKAQEVFEQLLVNLKNADNEVVLMDLKILAKTGKFFVHDSLFTDRQKELVSMRIMRLYGSVF